MTIPERAVERAREIDEEAIREREETGPFIFGYHDEDAETPEEFLDGCFTDLSFMEQKYVLDVANKEAYPDGDRRVAHLPVQRARNYIKQGHPITFSMAPEFLNCIAYSREALFRREDGWVVDHDPAVRAADDGLRLEPGSPHNKVYRGDSLSEALHDADATDGPIESFGGEIDDREKNAVWYGTVPGAAPAIGTDAVDECIGKETPLMIVEIEKT